MPLPRAWLFDLDGTLLRGKRPLAGAGSLLQALSQEGWAWGVLTNNSALPRSDHALRLRRLGLPVSEEAVFTSGRFAALELARLYPQARWYLLGTPALAAELGALGLRLSEEEPDGVLVGFDTTLSYSRLARACRLLEGGALFFATHPDPACPEEGGLLPDAGALLALLERATGRRPEGVLGKPNPAFLAYALGELGLEPEACLYVGDRLEVDVPFALEAGVRAALVLTGATRPEDPRIKEVQAQGVLVVRDLGELKERLWP
jgi:HAD superfamily hydrolase (TIGR01450 family)